MIDSDFSIGFKQGQQHGKEIMLEVIEDIRKEIADSVQWHFDNQQEDCAQVLAEALQIIDKHTSGKEQE